MTKPHPKTIGRVYCDGCGAPQARWKPESAGQSQSRCPSCGSPRSQWRKLVEVDKKLPVAIVKNQYGLSTLRKVESNQKVIDAKRRQAVEMALNTANGDKYLAMWEERAERRRRRYDKAITRDNHHLAKNPELMMEPTLQDRLDRKKAPSASEQMRADEAW